MFCHIVFLVGCPSLYNTAVIRIILHVSYTTRTLLYIKVCCNNCPSNCVSLALNWFWYRTEITVRSCSCLFFDSCFMKTHFCRVPATVLNSRLALTNPWFLKHPKRPWIVFENVKYALISLVSATQKKTTTAQRDGRNATCKVTVQEPMAACIK